MDIQAILSRVDHTLLSPAATWEEIRAVLDDAIRYRTASACIPPSYVSRARAYAGDGLTICTVVGFPNGSSTTAVKVFETADAVKNGAGEIDMVVNLGWVKDGLWDEVLAEIRAVRAACGGHILKVIIETCLLTGDEKIKLCQLVSLSGADFIKTSTGFSAHGATPEDVALLRAHVAPDVGVKAAGGISSLEDAASYLALGASRLGTSRVVKLVKDLRPDLP